MSTTIDVPVPRGPPLEEIVGEKTPIPKDHLSPEEVHLLELYKTLENQYAKGEPVIVNYYKKGGPKKFLWHFVDGDWINCPTFIEDYQNYRYKPEFFISVKDLELYKSQKPRENPPLLLSREYIERRLSNPHHPINIPDKYGDK